jgi:membrane dipeptidase
MKFLIPKNKMNKSALKTTLLCLFFYQTTAFSQDKFLEKANKIHQKAITIDTHADVPIMMAKEGFDISKLHDFSKDGSQIDIPRMEKGGMDGMFFAVYVGQGERSAKGNAEAKAKALKIFDMIHAVPKKFPDKAELAVSVADVKRIHKTGKRIVLIGMENGWPIGNDLNNLDEFYQLGLRYITLSHSFNNDICDSSGDPEGGKFNGVSPFGETVIKKMNDLGMMIDISHVSDSSFYDVIRLTKTPLIASHSSCRELCNHRRNMDDAMIRTLAQNGGVIQINFVPDFIKKPAEPHEISLKALRMKMMRAETTAAEQAQIDVEMAKLKEKYKGDMPSVKDAVDHIEHVVRMVGIDHVGIGMDMDGGGELSDCKDVSEIKNITIELLKRGFSEKDILKIWGGNILRVMKKVEDYAKKNTK